MAVRCRICLSPKRSEVDAALLRSETTAKVAADYGFSQSAVSRHQRTHLKAQVQALGKGLMPLLLPPPSPLDLIPSMTSMLSKLGTTISRAEQLVQDAEAEGGIAARAVSLNALKAALVDTAKLLAVLGPQGSPEPAPEQIDRQAVRDALAAVLNGDRDAVLDRLLA